MADTDEQLAAGAFNPDDREPMPDPDLEKQRADLEDAAPALADVLPRALAMMERRAGGRDEPAPVPWPTVAAALGGGLWRGLHMLVGNPGSGKSQLALQAALHAAEQGVPVLYVGLELDREAVAMRLVGLKIKKRWSGLALGERPELLGKVRSVAADLADLPLRLEAAGPNGWKASDLHSRTVAMLDRYAAELNTEPTRPALVVVDFLQIMAGDAQDLRQRIQGAVYAGRALAQQHNVAVLMVSSTARENYRTLDNVPPTYTNAGEPPKWWKTLGDGSPGRLIGLGKESGEVEYAADNVLVLGRDRGAGLVDREWSTIWLALAKQRARPNTDAARKGWVKLLFNGGRFKEVDPGAPMKDGPGA
jgi:replicative DNA helicase